MKKLLLSFLLVGLTFFGFSSAVNYSIFCSPDQLECSPNPVITFNDPVTEFCLTNFSVNGNGQSIEQVGYGINGYYAGNFNIDGNNEYCVSNGGYDINSFYLLNSQGYSNFDVSFSYFDGTEDVPIIPGGFSNFTPVVIGLGVTVTEIIPYVVYISIGFLIVVLGFFAIKWLCNLFLAKINSVFKSKRG